eukprot:1410224-Pleurochrysis_carterae.AAC.2
MSFVLHHARAATAQTRSKKGQLEEDKDLWHGRGAEGEISSRSGCDLGVHGVDNELAVWKNARLEPYLVEVMMDRWK